MAAKKQRPVRASEVRSGRAYYAPVPLMVPLGAQSDPSSERKPQCMLLPSVGKGEVAAIKNLIKSGALVYRSRGKALKQAKAGNWIRRQVPKEIVQLAMVQPISSRAMPSI